MRMACFLPFGATPQKWKRTDATDFARRYGVSHTIGPCMQHFTVALYIGLSRSIGKAPEGSLRDV